MKATATGERPTLIAMLQWLKDNETLAWWLLVASAVMFFGSLLLIPWLAARIPPDYFSEKKRPHSPLHAQHPATWVTLAILRNLLGAILVIAGIAMLLLPGQGILAIVMGVMLLNFPGKYRLERWIIRKPAVHKPINWLRRKSKREPLEIP